MQPQLAATPKAKGKVAKAGSTAKKVKAVEPAKTEAELLVSLLAPLVRELAVMYGTGWFPDTTDPNFGEWREPGAGLSHQTVQSS